MDVLVVTHPLAASRLTALRDAATDRAGFRAALGELSAMLVYEATRDLRVEAVTVQSPLGPAPGTRLAVDPLLLPVLRAGLGMVEAAAGLLPDAPVGFVGLARDETTHQPGVYLESLPATLDGRPVLLLDPMVATGGSALHCARLLAGRDAGPITVVSVLASPEGVAALRDSGLLATLVTAAVDERLNDDAFIVPGLGDAGDRQFGAV